MKKSTIIILVIVGFIAILGLSITNDYNSMINLREDVKTKEADIDVALKRRSDLIPNLVSTVKGYMNHEEKVIEDISNARENMLKANTVQDKIQADSDLSKAINNLLVVVENYPDLKANTNFINLQDELAGTENRIATARRDYNSAAKTYNTTIKKFPNSIIASMFNFEEVQYFEVSEEDTKVPNVEF